MQEDPYIKLQNLRDENACLSRKLADLRNNNTQSANNSPEETKTVKIEDVSFRKAKDEYEQLIGEMPAIKAEYNKIMAEKVNINQEIENLGVVYNKELIPKHKKAAKLTTNYYQSIVSKLEEMNIEGLDELKKLISDVQTKRDSVCTLQDEADRIRQFISINERHEKLRLDTVGDATKQINAIALTPGSLRKHVQFKIAE